MKLYGSLRELVAAVFRKDAKEITLEPNAGTYSGAVNLKLPPVLTGSDVLVSEAGSQSLTNKTIDADLNTVSNIDDGNIKAGAGIDAAKIGAGSVDNTEFGYLNGVTSSIQTQLGGKAASGANSDITSLSGLTTALSTGQGGTGVNSTATFPSSGVVVTEAGSATLTNKTIDGDNNTVQDLGLSSLKTVLADANKAILRDAAGAVTSALIANANISPTAAIDASKIGAGSVDNTEFGYLNGVTSSIQTQLGGKASSGANSDITSLSGLTTALSIGQGGTGQTSASAAINALLPSQTANDNKYLKTNGTTVSWASASGGAGEINAVLNSSGADGISGWVNGTSHTINTVTGATIPLSPAVPTAFTMSSSAAIAIGSQTSSSGDYYEFTMPPALRNRKLKFEFYYTTPASADGTWGVAVYNGATKVRLSTDTGATPDTVLPAGVSGGKFTAYFDTDAGTTYRVNFVQRTRTNTNSLWVTNVVVGPGIQPQGAVVGEWESYTPTLVGNGSKVFTINTARYRRVGSSIEIDLDLRGNATASGSAGTTNFTASLPSGLTFDSSLSIFNDSLGSAVTYGLLAASQYDRQILVTPATSTSIGWMKPGGATLYRISDLNVANSVEFKTRITAPIAEWAGSGTVQLAQNDVEYAASTSGTWDAAASAAQTVYGPDGAPISGTLTAQRNKVVRFQTPIQAGDKLVLELNNGNGWASLNDIGWAYVRQGSFETGASVSVTNSTDVTVSFYQYSVSSNTGYGVATGATNWPSGYKWRVRKSSAGAAVGFGIHQPGVSAGLVSASGLVGNTTGNAIASGYVGELFGTQRAGTGGDSYSTRSTTSVPATTASSVISVTLNKGVYLVSYKIRCASSTTSNLDARLHIGGTAVESTNSQGTATTAQFASATNSLPVVITADSTVVAVYARLDTGTSSGNLHELWAVRIA